MRRNQKEVAEAIVQRIPVMRRLIRRQGKEPGMAPGTLVHTGPQRVEAVRLQAFEYGEGEVREFRPEALTDLFPLPAAPAVTWLNLDGLHDPDLLRALGETLDLHPLLLEDVASVGQRPKVDEYPDHLYIVLRMLSYDETRDEVLEEQVSIVLGRGLIVSFQETPGDVFEPIRTRLRTGKGLIRSRPADYLAYALVDAVVDGYFAVVEKVGDRIEEVGQQIMAGPERHTMQNIHHLRRELILLRKAVWPVRDLLNALIRDESELVSPATKVFLRDAYDHAVQVIDTVETLRDLVSGLIDVYLSTTSMRMNEVMKVLTIIATIFIPLTFIAGVYGMNFEYMPELTVWWAYPAVMLAMLLIAVGMLIQFRRRNWI